MALGIPVVVHAGVGDVDQIVADTGAGIVVHGFDQAILMAAVDDLFALNSSAADIRAGARRWFDLEKGVGAYDSIYRSLAHP